MRIQIAILFACLSLLGCKSQDVSITVVNGSSAPLTSVVATGSGYSASLSPVAPGAQGKVTIPRPSDTAGLTLDFDAGGKHHTSTCALSVWFGMNEVILKVQPGYTVETETITSF